MKFVKLEVSFSTLSHLSTSNTRETYHLPYVSYIPQVRILSHYKAVIEILKFHILVIWNEEKGEAQVQ
jgi:hypothetical protein